MDKLAQALDLVILSIKHNSLFVLKLLMILWVFHIFNWLTHYRLNRLGILPRTFVGLRGIIFSPLLHGDFNHLFFNSVPFFVLSNLVLLNGRTVFYVVSLFIIISGGFAIWLFAKRAIHIGASTLIMGYFGYLLAEAYFQFTAVTIIVAIVALYYFGGLVLSLFPGKKHISWEGHVFGFAAGIGAAYLSPFLMSMVR